MDSLFARKFIGQLLGEKKGGSGCNDCDMRVLLNSDKFKSITFHASFLNDQEYIIFYSKLMEKLALIVDRLIPQPVIMYATELLYRRLAHKKVFIHTGPETDNYLDHEKKEATHEYCIEFEVIQIKQSLYRSDSKGRILAILTHESLHHLQVNKHSLQRFFCLQQIGRIYPEVFDKFIEKPACRHTAKILHKFLKTKNPHMFLSKRYEAESRSLNPKMNQAFKGSYPYTFFSGKTYKPFICNL